MTHLQNVLPSVRSMRNVLVTRHEMLYLPVDAYRTHGMCGEYSQKPRMDALTSGEREEGQGTRDREGGNGGRTRLCGVLALGAAHVA